MLQVIAAESGVAPRRVIKRDGATWIDGLRLIGDFGEA
jgi:predicted ATPase